LWIGADKKFLLGTCSAGHAELDDSRGQVIFLRVSFAGIESGAWFDVGVTVKADALDGQLEANGRGRPVFCLFLAFLIFFVPSIGVYIIAIGLGGGK